MSDETSTPLFPRVIDNTMYSDWKACPHRFFRRHCQGLTRGGPNVHLHFGGAFAAAQETVRLEWLEHYDLEDAVKAGCERFIDYWGDFEMPEYANQTMLNKSLAAGLIAVQEYYRQWPLDEDPLTIYIHEGKPAVEFSFALPIPGSRHPTTDEPLVYCGRFDMIGALGSSLHGLDDKTTSSLGQHWRNQWKLRSQFTGYVWGAREYGLHLDGFIIRGTCILKSSVTFDEASVPCPPHKVERWLAQLCEDTKRMSEQFRACEVASALHQHQEPHPFGRNLDHACSDFNGCAYLDLCSAERPEAWLDDFIVERWNPLTRQGA